MWCGVWCVSGASCLEIFLEQVARKGDTQECRSGARREQNPGISPGASLPGQLASLCLARLYSKAAELSPRPSCAFPCKIRLLQKLLSQVSQNPLLPAHHCGYLIRFPALPSSQPPQVSDHPWLGRILLGEFGQNLLWLGAAFSIE